MSSLEIDLLIGFVVQFVVDDDDYSISTSTSTSTREISVARFRSVQILIEH